MSEDTFQTMVEPTYNTTISLSRVGRAQSSGLSNICEAEFPKAAIMQENEIKGIQIGNKVKLSLFPDL